MGIFIEPHVRALFEAYGPFAYRFRWPLFICPLILTALLSVGLFRLEELRIDDPSYVFTPTDARWREEMDSFSKTWPLNENKFLPGKSFELKRFINILIRSKDGGDVLRDHVVKEIGILNDWITNNLSVPTHDRRFNLTYQDLCLSYDWVCVGNEHIEMFLQRQKVGKVIDLSYPRGGNKDTPVYLGTLLGDITLNKENRTVSSANITQLFYFLKQEPTLIRDYSSDFSYAVERFLLKAFTSDVIELSFAHYQSLKDGLDENAERFLPNFVFSFTVLSVYALLSAFCFKRKPYHGIDWIRSKPLLACAGLTTTLMAITCSFGLLLLLGVSYNVINTIIPFLIIAIGIDDMFIMNACWEATDDSLSVPERMAKTLSHAGVAVTITNVTDIMSFAIGCITNLPGIQLFCLYATTAVSFCYMFQLTYFCAFMAIMGDVEKNQRHCIFLTKSAGKVNIAELESSTKFPSNMRKFQRTRSNTSPDSSSSASCSSSDYSDMGSYSSKKTIKQSHLQQVKVLDTIPPLYQVAIQTKPAQPVETSKIVKFFVESYGPFLLATPTRLFAAVAFPLYVAVAIYGCLNFREGLNPANLVTNDHYISHYFTDIKSFWKSGPQLHVAIFNPPRLWDETGRNQILRMVSAFENTPYTMGREGTVFFLLEYMNYLDELNVELDNTKKIWDTKLRSWLKYTGASSAWAADIRYNETDDTFEAFRFEVAMKNIVEPNDHKHAASLLREIADSQPFKVQLFHEAFPFADQYLIILPATIQNVVISLLCMTGVSLLMVPSLPSGVIIVMAIVSINVGVFGYMTLWGVNLDAVSMISIIMSIGFAADLSAHIIYAFVTSHGNSHDRVIGALEALGWPIFQGASSTIAGISILYTVDAYIILTFFKTIWLTMVIGAIHGLFFIPIFLSVFPVSFFHIPKSSELH